MAKAKQLNDAFLTAKSKTDIEIEKATYRNIARFEDSEIAEIHANLMKVFDIKSTKESKYFDIKSFRTLVSDSREKKATLQEKAKKATEEKRNAELLAMKNKQR